jgi:hypothetical protein
MKPHYAFLFSLTLLMSSQAYSQTSRSVAPAFDLAVSASAGRLSTAVSWSRLHGLALKKKLRAGYGVRFTGFVAANKFYTTAPAKYTSPVQNLWTIFSRTIVENIDTITTATSNVYALNLAIYLDYQINSNFELGFNIDALGLSFGPKKQFNIISSSFDVDQPPVVEGSPTAFNLLLTSDNDIGSLNSEFFVRWWLSQKVGFRLGYTFLFTEYKTTQKLSFNNGEILNDRYRNKASLALLAITFKPLKQ